MKKFNLNNRLKVLCFSVIFCLFSMAANASVINFNSMAGPNAGMVSYDGSGGSLVGMFIDIGEISGIGTNSHSGETFNCLGCQLSFATGTLNMADSSGSTYIFDAGGFFEISGTLQTGTMAADIDGTGSTPLLTGEWTSQITVNVFSGVFAVSQGFGTDTKHPGLLDFFGETGAEFTFASTNIQLADALIAGDLAGFDTNVVQAIVSNVANVPLPGAVWLMGSGLIGLLGVSRRRV